MQRKSSNNPWISPNGYLNSASFAQIGGPETVGQRFPGALGGKIVCSNADALKLSNTAVGTLYQGEYQLVKIAAGVTLSRGQLVFWDTLANNGLNDFEVTNTVAAAAVFKAGVALYTGTAGQYCWIQTGGLANLLFRAAVTSAVLGNLVVMTALNDPLADGIADATDYFTTAGAYKRTIGLAYELPANGSITRVLLDAGSFVENNPS